MAILRISRPALACLLLWLALSQEAPQEDSQDAPREAKKGVKCKNPKGSEGDYYYEGCYKYICVKASKKAGIWIKYPALDICCVQNATLFPTGTIIQESMPNDYTLVLLKCEQLEYFPSIVPEVYYVNPPLEIIEEKLDNLCDKAEEILEAVQECSEEEEQVILIAGGDSKSLELYNPKTGFTCCLTDLPNNRYGPVVSGLRVCGGGYKDCIKFLFEGEGKWEQSNLLFSPREFSSGWDSSAGLVLMGGYDQPGTSEILIWDEFYSQYSFNITPPRESACSIPYNYDSVLLTGGYDPDADYSYTLTLVQQYNLNGLVLKPEPPIPNLNYPRENHGCGYYHNKDGERVFLVAGGFNYDDYYYYYDSDSDLSKKDRSYYYSTYDYYSSYTLSSTEIWVPGWDYWIYADPLPEPVAGAAYVSLYNNIYLLGNYIGDSNSVYVWKGETEEWYSGYPLIKGKAFAGASTVPVSSGILDYCLPYCPYEPYSTYGPFVKEEDQPEPLKRIHDIIAARKKKVNTE